MRRLAAAILLAATACGGGASPAGDASPAPGTVTVIVEQGRRDLRVRAEVAATPDDRERGLSGREEVAGGEGMLFLFRAPKTMSFWMKDTLVPLDVAFITGDRITQIERLEPCGAGPCPFTRSRVQGSRALEVRAGTFADAGIGPGARVRILGALPAAS